MADITTTLPAPTSFPRPAPLPRPLVVRFRLWRRQRARRRFITLVTSEHHTDSVLADAGVLKQPKSLLERFGVAMTYLPR